MIYDTFYEALAMQAAAIEAAVSEMPKHRFSLRHRLRMKNLFRNYEKSKIGRSVSVSAEAPVNRLKLNRKTVITITAIVMLSLLAGCAAAYFIAEAFRGNVYSDNTDIQILLL